VICKVLMCIGIRLRVVVNGHVDRGQRREKMITKPLSEIEIWGVGAPCIVSSKVTKCDVSFRLSLWSRVVVMWRRIREEIAYTMPLSNFGYCESQGN
jgi:hypothetical protein